MGLGRLRTDSLDVFLENWKEVWRALGPGGRAGTPPPGSWSLGMLQRNLLGPNWVREVEQRERQLEGETERE